MSQLAALFLITALSLSKAYAQSTQCFDPRKPVDQTPYVLVIDTADSKKIASLDRQIKTDKILKVVETLGSVEEDHYITMLVSVTPELVALLKQNRQMDRIDAGVFEYVRRLMDQYQLSEYAFNCTQKAIPLPRAGGTN